MSSSSMSPPRYKAEQIPVAAVATGFPSGQYSLDTRLQEIKLAVAAGARHYYTSTAILDYKALCI